MRAALAQWPARRWWTAALAATAVVLVIAIPTDLIDTPAFGRAIAPTWWAWPSLLVSATLAGLLVASYVANPTQLEVERATTRGGWIGTALTYFAVGCPVCNKVVLLALGSSGALTWFQPAQPLLQVAGLVLLAWALRKRLLGELSCPTTLEEVRA
jgi:hypothetical protein